MHLQQFVVQANIYILIWLGSVPCFGFCISTFSCNERNATFLSWSAAASLEESLGGSWVRYQPLWGCILFWYLLLLNKNWLCTVPLEHDSSYACTTGVLGMALQDPDGVSPWPWGAAIGCGTNSSSCFLFCLAVIGTVVNNNHITFMATYMKMNNSSIVQSQQ